MTSRDDKTDMEQDKPATPKEARQMSPYEMLLFEYACGTLDEARSLLIAAHLTLDEAARRYVSLYETMGGALLESVCEPVKMKKDSLKAVIARLEEEVDAQENDAREVQSRQDTTAESNPLWPRPIARYIKDCRRTGISSVQWKTVFPGISVMKLSSRSSAPQIRVVRVKPGVKVPQNRHEERELTLVLEGRLHDRGKVYQAGDVVINARLSAHSPYACEEKGCVCLTVGGWHGGIYGFFERLLNL